MLLLSPSLSGGGAERQVERLARFAASSGDVMVGLLRAENRGDLKNIVELRVIGRTMSSSWAAAISARAGIRAAVRDFKPNIVVSVLPHLNCALLSVSPIGARCIVGLRSSLRRTGSDLRTRIALFIERRSIATMYERADKIWSVSDGLRNQIVQCNPRLKNRVFVTQNPIDVADVRRRATPGTIFDAYPRPIFVGCGRLVDAKGFDDLIKAFSMLSWSKRGTLVIVGSGPKEYALRSLVRSLGIEKQVFFTGHINNPYSIIRQGDVFVLSSRWEGCPNVILEAMACGKPVVSTDCETGPRELIRHGQTGILVPCGDLRALSSAIGQLGADKDLQIQMGEAGSQRASEFDSKAILPVLWRNLTEGLG